MATTEEYLKTLNKLKGKDRVGVAGTSLGTGLGVAGGVAASGTIAGAAGATTLLGSSTLGSVLGGVFVTSTPIGWVVGSAVAAGAIGYGISKMIHSGGENDQIRKDLRNNIQNNLQNNLRAQPSQKITETKYDLFIEKLKIAVYRDLVSQEKSEKLIYLVENGKMDIGIATNRLYELIKR